MKMVISRRDIYRKRSRAILKSVMKMAVGDDFWKRVDVYNIIEEEKQSNYKISDENGHW